ncbi:MAG TPA: prepilin-type N-terminal cleavage/methylation domain-containing protein [Candidatus Paceibacterota bacterium]|nr:prepilin-type N-terminal cleavage/methylation domain-containing protein [Candidatus Paceibacterota bacterium]
MHQKGFALLELLIVAIVIALVAGGAWYASHLQLARNQPISNSVVPVNVSSASGPSSTISTSVQMAEPANSGTSTNPTSTISWQTYHDPEFTLIIPTDWTASTTSSVISLAYPENTSTVPYRSITFTSQALNGPVLIITAVPHGYDMVDQSDDAPACLATNGQHDFYYSTWNGNTPAGLLSEVRQSVASFKTQAFAVSLPITALPWTFAGTSGSNAGYPKKISIGVPPEFAGQIAAYGVAGKVWLGPAGWTGSGSEGQDGSLEVNLYPSGESATSGPHVSYENIPACSNCMLYAAGTYFPAARQEEAGTYPYATSTIPQGLVVSTVSPTLVTYELPNQNGLLTRGVAYYDPHNDPLGFYYLEATYVLPQSQADLANALVQAFIGQEGLK